MFDANRAVDHRTCREPLTDRPCQTLRVVGSERDHVPPDPTLQAGRRVERDERPAIEDPDPVTLLRLFHEMGRHEHRDPFPLPERPRIRPKVPPDAGIEAERRLVQEQDTRRMEEALGDLDAAPEPSRESFHPVVRAVPDAQPIQELRRARRELRAPEAVQVALMPQVLHWRQVSWTSSAGC